MNEIQTISFLPNSGVINVFFRRGGATGNGAACASPFGGSGGL